MDLGPTEFQRILRENARPFLETEARWPAVREVMDSELGYSPETWRKMAELGWLGLALPEADGGSGGTLGDVSVLLEEIGRVVLPSPFMSTWLGSLAVLWGGSEEVRREVLPAVVRGEARLAVAWVEAAGRYEPEYLKLRAARAGDGYVLNGEKLFVRDAHLADYLVVIAREGDGRTALLVDARAPGVGCERMPSAARDRQSAVRFEDVHVPAGRALGGPGGSGALVERLEMYGTVAECAELTGMGEKVLEMSVEYAKGRVQFGRPIGSFQAIQHKCADMVTDVDGCRLITQYAIWKLETGQPAAVDVARAKTWVSAAIRRITREGQQIHGGIGFILETPLHLYFLRAKTGELMWGGADLHRRRVGEALLGGDVIA